MDKNARAANRQRFVANAVTAAKNKLDRIQMMKFVVFFLSIFDNYIFKIC
jgi:hypothetical protein